MTTTTQPRTLQQQIAAARAHQLATRIAWARSPNADTIRQEKAASRYLDVLLDRLSAALKAR